MLELMRNFPFYPLKKDVLIHFIELKRHRLKFIGTNFVPDNNTSKKITILVTGYKRKQGPAIRQGLV